MSKSDEIIKKAAEILGEMNNDKKAEKQNIEKDRQTFVALAAKEIVRVLGPVLEKVANSSKMSKEDMLKAVKEIKVEVPRMPDIIVPEIRVPTPQVTVQAPEVRIPEIKIPEQRFELPSVMDVRMIGVDREQPMPVIMMDMKGRPMSFPTGASGGKGDFFTIKDIRNSSGASIISNDGAMKVEGALSATLAADTGEGEVGTDTLRTVQATDSIASVAVKEIFGSTITTLLNGDNRIPVSVETGGSGLTDSELRASAVPVSQVSGAVWSTEATASGNVADNGVDSGNPVKVGGKYNSTKPTYADGDRADLQVGQRGALIASLFANDSATAISSEADDSDGVSTSAAVNNLSVMARNTWFNGTTWDRARGNTNGQFIHGTTAHDSADAGNPVKVGFKARTANPTPVAANDRTDAYADTVGRQIVRPVQVRGLMQTAFVSVVNGTEATLLAGATGVYHDLVYVMAANHSDAAVSIDIRQSTGGTVQMALEVPANGTAGVSLPIPIPQDHADASWTVDMADDTQDCDITALFSKEV